MDEGRAKLKKPYFWWWTMWTVNGREYANNFNASMGPEARKAHSQDLTFRWAQGLGRPTVSQLWFVHDKGVDTVADGADRDPPGRTRPADAPVFRTASSDALPF